jgi:RNA polymerase sigma-70 factor (ECF subfamily)
VADRAGNSLSVPTDGELVDRLRKSDERAFEILYQRYFKRIYHFVEKRLGVRADAEETTQEVFICVFSSIDSYRGEAPVAAWIFGITRRVIAARFKRKRHTTVPLSDDDSESPAEFGHHKSSEPSPLEAYECQERVWRMTATLEQKLSREQRMLFRLHHVDERPISEIALAMDKSEDAVKSNLYRTRKLLLAR